MDCDQFKKELWDILNEKALLDILCGFWKMTNFIVKNKTKYELYNYDHDECIKEIFNERVTCIIKYKNKFVTGDSKGNLMLWNNDFTFDKIILADSSIYFTKIIEYNKHNLIICGDNRGQIRMINIASGNCKKRFVIEKFITNLIMYDPDMIIVDTNLRVYLINIKKLKLIEEFEDVSRVELCDDKLIMAKINGGQHVHVWSIPKKEYLYNLDINDCNLSLTVSNNACFYYDASKKIIKMLLHNIIIPIDKIDVKQNYVRWMHIIGNRLFLNFFENCHIYCSKNNNIYDISSWVFEKETNFKFLYEILT